jgi:hypothetical protein
MQLPDKRTDAQPQAVRVHQSCEHETSACQQDVRGARQRDSERRQALLDQEAQLILGERVRLYECVVRIR